MNASGRTYVASHYQNGGSAAARSGRYGMPPLREKSEVRPLGKAEVRAMPDSVLRAPYRISTLTIPAEPKPMLVDVAVHEHESNNVVVVCPGACEPLAGRVIEYAALARTIVDAGLGAVVRYSDPYDHEGNYAELLLEKLRQVIEFTLSSASHFCSTANPRLHLMAYSSSAGAAAALTAEYESIESLLLIAPSYDVPHHTVGPAYRRFRGNVRVLIGESDAVVLPQQAFWYYEQAESAASREYVEVPCCGHSFEGPDNKSIFFRDRYGPSEKPGRGTFRLPGWPPATLGRDVLRRLCGNARDAAACTSASATGATGRLHVIWTNMSIELRYGVILREPKRPKDLPATYHYEIGENLGVFAQLREFNHHSASYSLADPSVA